MSVPPVMGDLALCADRGGYGYESPRLLSAAWGQRPQALRTYLRAGWQMSACIGALLTKRDRDA